MPAVTFFVTSCTAGLIFSGAACTVLAVELTLVPSDRTRTAISFCPAVSFPLPKEIFWLLELEEILPE